MAPGTRGALKSENKRKGNTRRISTIGDLDKIKEMKVKAIRNRIINLNNVKNLKERSRMGVGAKGARAKSERKRRICVQGRGGLERGLETLSRDQFRKYKQIYKIVGTKCEENVKGARGVL